MSFQHERGAEAGVASLKSLASLPIAAQSVTTLATMPLARGHYHLSAVAVGSSPNPAAEGFLVKATFSPAYIVGADADLASEVNAGAIRIIDVGFAAGRTAGAASGTIWIDTETDIAIVADATTDPAATGGTLELVELVAIRLGPDSSVAGVTIA